MISWSSVKYAIPMTFSPGRRNGISGFSFSIGYPLSGYTLPCIGAPEWIAEAHTKSGAGLSFDLLEHPADIGFRARGATLEELFANSAHALLSIILASSNIRPIQSISIPGSGADPESLLVNWLNEVLYYVDGRRMALGTFDVVRVDETRVECIARGEPRDRDRHASRLGVKAVTYHQLKVALMEGGWIAEVFVDI
jgi:SHS2 domain-containing protein